MKSAKPFSPDFGSLGSPLESLLASLSLPLGFLAGVRSELSATPAGICSGADSTWPSDRQAVNSSDGNIENLGSWGKRARPLRASVLQAETVASILPANLVK